MIPCFILVFVETFTMLAALPMFRVPIALSPLPESPRKPPVAKAVVPTSTPVFQDYHHQETMAILCIDPEGFTLSTGRVSYASDGLSKKLLRSTLNRSGASKLFFTDLRSKRYFKILFRKARVPFQTFLMHRRKSPQSKLCPFCYKNCHRWNAVTNGTSIFYRTAIDPIPH